ncbi:MAG: hypothetical protein K6E27_02990 [Eubacterium sp.]|nr:hypothetical protein [Eubacterium sp.]
MKKIVVGDYELQTEGLIMGAVIATGAGLVGLGVKNLLDAKKLKYAAEQPVDEDLEFEEYKENKSRKLKKKRDAKLRRGIVGISVGAFATAVGVAAFTPLRRYVVNDDFTLRTDRAEQLDGVVSSVRELSGSLKGGVQNKVQTVRNIDISDIKDELSSIKENIPDINDIKNNLPDINEIKSNIPDIKSNIPSIKLYCGKSCCGKTCCGRSCKCSFPCISSLRSKAPDFDDVKANIQNIKALIIKVHTIKKVSEKLESKLQDILAKLA